MHKKQNQFSKFVLIILFLSAVVTSCSRDKDIVDIVSPAYHISESEKVVIPDAVSLPANGGNTTRVATYYATGVQKYKAMPKAGTNEFEWVFVAPYAELYDAANRHVGTHSAGPTWQLSPGDSIYAQPFTPAKTAASTEAGTIDWLLLMAKDGKTPTGVFTNVYYIQRIATKGGKAPATPPTIAGSAIDVPYTAVYRFTKKN